MGSLPQSSTNTIRATVKPRKTSREDKRSRGARGGVASVMAAAALDWMCEVPSSGTVSPSELLVCSCDWELAEAEV